MVFCAVMLAGVDKAFDWAAHPTGISVTVLPLPCMAGQRRHCSPIALNRSLHLLYEHCSHSRAALERPLGDRGRLWTPCQSHLATIRRLFHDAPQQKSQQISIGWESRGPQFACCMSCTADSEFYPLRICFFVHTVPFRHGTYIHLTAYSTICHLDWRSRRAVSKRWVSSAKRNLSNRPGTLFYGMPVFLPPITSTTSKRPVPSSSTRRRGKIRYRTPILPWSRHPRDETCSMSIRP